MDIIRLPCNHCFIPEAIERWVKEENALCPVCRYNLDSKEVETEEASTSSGTQSLLAAISRSHAPSLLSSIIQPLSAPVRNNLPRTANSFLQDIVQRVVMEREEDELQQAILNSLTSS